MRNELFKKANWFLKNNKVKKTFEGDRMSEYVVNGKFKVALFYKPNRPDLFFMCDCMHAVMKVPTINSPCSHILAVFAFRSSSPTASADAEDLICVKEEFQK